MKMATLGITRKRWRWCSAIVYSLMLTIPLQLTVRTARAEGVLDKTIKLDIQENTELEDALIEWGTKAGMTVMINTPTVSHQISHGVHGTLSARKALLAILRDSGLSYTQDGERIRIVPAATIVHSVLREGRRESGAAESPSLFSDTTESSPSGVANDTSENESEARRKFLETVVVTAQKRVERVQDVPVPLTVMNAQDLVDQNKLRLQDYYDNVPGLIFTPGGGGGVVTLRGMSPPTGVGNATTAILIDGVPVGVPAGFSSIFQVPDLDPSSLDRVEVLRGPQGTLWGANTIGGLINFVTKAPSTNALSGRVQADLSTVTNGDGPNYSGRGTVNIPISDTLAIRASGFANRDAGYIDNLEPQPEQKGSNWGNSAGGLLATLWQPSESASLQLRALVQNSTSHATPIVWLGAGFKDLQQTYLPGGEAHSHVENYSAVFDLKLTSSLELTSLTGYDRYVQSTNTDATAIFQALLPSVFPSTYSPTADYSNPVYNTSSGYTEELRLSAKLGSAIDWLVGGFYSHNSDRVSNHYYEADSVTGAPTAYVIGSDPQQWYREAAVFTNLTIHFTRRLDLQLGGRESFLRQYFQDTDTGSDPVVTLFEGTSSPAVYPGEWTKANVFTWLFTPSFKISPDVMTYARIASGYRLGGPNINDVGVFFFEVPPEFKPDTTRNYEVGIKGDFFDHKIAIDSSVYYVDWKDMQTVLMTPNHLLVYIGNAGKAKSEGVELSLQVRPFSGSTIGGWVEWNEAIVTEGSPSLPPLPSGQLPNTPRWSGNISLEQEFPLGSRVTGFVGGVETYMGQRPIYIGPSQPGSAQMLGPYAKTDLHAGARFEEWTMNLFANNVTDRRGLLSYGLGPMTYTILTPRTVGITISRTF